MSVRVTVCPTAHRLWAYYRTASVRLQEPLDADFLPYLAGDRYGRSFRIDIVCIASIVRRGSLRSCPQICSPSKIKLTDNHRALTGGVGRIEEVIVCELFLTDSGGEIRKSFRLGRYRQVLMSRVC